MKRWCILKSLWLPFTKSNASVHATSACYYILLSLIPASLLMTSLLPYLPISPTSWTQGLQQLIPGQFFSIIQSLIPSAASPVLASASAVVLLWSASKGVLAISDGLCALIGIPHGTRFIWRRLSAMLSFVLLSVLLFFILGLYVFGKRLLPFLGALSFPLYRLRYLYVPIALSAMFTSAYYFLPKRAVPFRFCLIGSTLSAIGWIACSSLFSVYVNLTSGFHQRYGSTGILILACLWLQFCITLLLYGGLLADLLAHREYHPIQILCESIRSK